MKRDDIRPTQEQLEARRLMAATPVPATAVVPYAGGQMLKIVGTAGNDTLTLSYDGSAYTIKTAAGFTKTFAGPFNAVKILAGKGNDRVTVDASVTIPTFLYGEDGNDTLTGGAGDDSLYAGAGTNWLYGNGGRDTLVTLGNNTNDGLTGGAGDDFFWVDNKAAERIYDASTFELANTVNRVSAFETSRFVTGTKTQAVATSIAGQRFRDPDLTSKSYVYKRFDDRPLFNTDGPSIDDVKQGQVGDCYFLSTLGGTADVAPETIRDMVSDLGDGTYAVRFKTALGATKFYRVDNDLAVFNKTSTTPAYAGLGTNGAMWVAIAEKAYAYYRRAQGTYASISGGWMNEVYTALGNTGGAQTKWKTDAATDDEYLDWVQQQLDDGKVVTMAVLTQNNTLNLVGGHAYTVVRVDTAADGTRTLIVRNPWAMDGYACRDGSNDGYVTLDAAGVRTGIDAVVASRAAA